MPFNIQGPELILILVIALLVIGPGKLPEVGAALGRSIREFRKAATDVKDAANVEPAPAVAAPKPAAAAQVEPPRAAPPVAAPSGDGPAVAAPPEPVAAAPGASDPDSPAS